MALKKLSDPYIIRASATTDTLAAGANPFSTVTANIDTGLDSLRREVLFVWAAFFGVTSDDDGIMQGECMDVLNTVITTGAAAFESCRYGVRMQLNKQPTGLIENLGNQNVLAFDSAVSTMSAVDSTGGNIASFLLETQEQRFPQSWDPNEPGVPLGIVTDSTMEFVVNQFVDGITTGQNIGGVDGSVKIIAQRMEADAALFASIITGNQ